MGFGQCGFTAFESAFRFFVAVFRVVVFLLADERLFVKALVPFEVFLLVLVFGKISVVGRLCRCQFAFEGNFIHFGDKLPLFYDRVVIDIYLVDDTRYLSTDFYFGYRFYGACCRNRVGYIATSHGDGNVGDLIFLSCVAEKVVAPYGSDNNHDNGDNDSFFHI